MELLAFLAVFVAALVLLALGALLFWWVARRSDSHRRSKRGRLAGVGEDEGARLLESRGYRVLERKARLTWEYEQDGHIESALLIADYVVERHGKRYVADAKTGAHTTMKNIATRRQLLEYQLAYDVDAVILVDMGARELHVVRFGARRSPA